MKYDILIYIGRDSEFLYGVSEQTKDNFKAWYYYPKSNAFEFFPGEYHNGSFINDSQIGKESIHIPHSQISKFKIREHIGSSGQ